MTVEDMKKRKRELGLTNESLAAMSGVPLGTVQKIFAGITKSPRKSTIDALYKALSVKDDTNIRSRYDQKTESTYDMIGEVREEAAEYVYNDDSRQGSYTLDDYYALPDERRVELIDGYIYDMGAPSLIHQTILGQLHIQLAACAIEHRGCRLFIAPADVRLDNDDHTMVQPDVFIVCSRNDGDIRRINGAPDFIIEILSHSSRFHDMFRKLNKYKSSGVREYWIVDYEKDRVTVYDFEHDELPFSYSFKDTVPVIISEGKCLVDFARIKEAVELYMRAE